MKIFDMEQAKHFCGQFKSSPGLSTGSIKDFHSTIKGRVIFKEGTKNFDEYRDCLLRDIDTCLLLSASLYRRSNDLMLASAASWAHVTLYYGSYYAARALAGMFGVWVDFPETRVEVAKGNIGSQEILIDRRKKENQLSTTYKGSHQAFWHFFYSSCQPLRPEIPDPQLILAIFPIGRDPTWQIDRRNEINYDVKKALNLISDFQNTFDPRTFPSCLPGHLNTQWKITEAMIVLAFFFAKQCLLKTDAFTFSVPPITISRAKIIEEWVDRALADASLSTKMKMSSLFC